jgi:arsenite/tail-anchored protein-transporting ATPase
VTDRRGHRADTHWGSSLRIVLFTGKGGVGKTTLAAATAARLARSGRKALVISTDPAHSLGDALGRPLTGDATEVDPGLYAAHLDARALVEGSWATLRGHLRTILAGAGVDELVADELTVLPGVEDLLALGEVRRAAAGGPWEVVIVDCGPTAETLRLLALPEAIAGYLERLYPAHRRAVRGLLAGVAAGAPNGRVSAAGATARRWDAAAEALGSLAEQLSGLRAMLADHHTTSIRLVLTPERLVAAETRRTMTALALHGLRVDGLVCNRVVPPIAPSVRGPAARWVRARRAEQEAVLGELAGLYPGGPSGAPVLRTVPYTAAEPIGVPALVEVADALYGRDEPLAGAEAAPLLEVRRTGGDGTSLESEFELLLRLPGLDGHTPLDLARIDDDLAVTVSGVRRLVTLPSVLARCAVQGARVGPDELVVVFRPDPSVWMLR